MTENLGFEAAGKRIDEIAEELARNPTSKGKLIIELRRLCGRHHTVPKLYKLEGITKEEERAQFNSQIAEIWKGRHNGEVVALKVLRAPREDLLRTKTRFYKEVVLMKQLNHDNIVPFYGVSTTISNFCLVFPWYENGNVMDYLKKEPDANRFDLLLGAANGLVFLHGSRLVHGSLKPSHILIDDNCAARLATAGRSSVVAVPGTSVAGHSQSELDENMYKCQYSAPEIQWPEDYDMEKVLITKESDVYSLAMVAYEVLSGEAPYAKYNGLDLLPRIQSGKLPERPPGRIPDSIWQLLGECWNRDPKKRPPTAEVYSAISKLSSTPKSPPVPPPVTEELPGKLEFQVRNIKISLGGSEQRRFSVRFRYGSKEYTTPPATGVAAGDEQTWKRPETWSVDTNKQHRGQRVYVEVVLRTWLFGRDKICAKGEFSLLNNANKPIHVELEMQDGTGSAVVEIFVKKAN